MARELNIVLFKRVSSAAGGAEYWRIGYEYSLSDFGGVLPGPGDTIVPYLSGVLDPAKHSVFVVESRFFRPTESAHQFINVGLVVAERTGEANEGLLIVGA